MSWNTLINYYTCSSKYPTIFGHDLFFSGDYPFGAPASAWSLTSGQAYSLDAKELFIKASNSVHTWANELIADNVTLEGCIGSRGVN